MLLALLQNDASLLGQTLSRLEPRLRFDLAEPPDAVGAGYVENNHALLRKRPGSSEAARRPLSLLEGVVSPAIVLQVRRQSRGTYKDENAPPYRFKRWIFAHYGEVARFGDLRPALLDQLPPFLQRAVRGQTDSEHLFALLLAQMKLRGILDATTVRLETLANAAHDTLQTIEALAAEVGGGGRSTLNLVATNGRYLLAARKGDLPLYWTVLEGAEAGAEHLKALVVSSHPEAPEAWTPMGDGEVLVTGRELEPLVRA
ncbi:MAG: hypothetical protein D6729_00495 [Deltaproteobacteria bacterium]|nr:MAG: hypothetical protein D6729_00495 [Deltaproteobacteria bacterium]